MHVWQDEQKCKKAMAKLYRNREASEGEGAVGLRSSHRKASESC